MQIYWTTIQKIIQESPDVVTYKLECPEGFSWDEGAHTHLALEGFNYGDKPNRGLIRHMSIMTLPHEQSIGITTRIRDLCSQYKEQLKKLTVGSSIALFKTHSNVPLKRENKHVYLLSSGVGLATFRPLVLEYFARMDDISYMHSLNIDSSKHFLFTDIFTSQRDKNFTSEFVNNRNEYYARVQELAADSDGIFYIVGSDEFLRENIEILRQYNIAPEQIMLDKRKKQLQNFLSFEQPV